MKKIMGFIFAICLLSSMSFALADWSLQGATIQSDDMLYLDGSGRVALDAEDNGTFTFYFYSGDKPNIKDYTTTLSTIKVYYDLCTIPASIDSSEIKMYYQANNVPDSFQPLQKIKDITTKALRKRFITDDMENILKASKLDTEAFKQALVLTPELNKSNYADYAKAFKVSSNDWLQKMSKALTDTFEPPTAAANKKEVLKTIEEWEKDLKAKRPADTSSFADWVISQQLLWMDDTANANKFTQDALDKSGLSEEQRAQISVISRLSGTRTTSHSLTPIGFKFNTAALSEDTYSVYLSLTEDGLAKFADNASLDARIATFANRIKYLTNLAKVRDVPVADAIKSFMDQGSTTSLFYPENATITSNKLDFVLNTEAYQYLVGTTMELSYYTSVMLKTLAPAVDNGTYKSMSSQIAQLANIKEGLDYLDSPELWLMWAREYDTGLNIKSLAQLYAELEQNSAFDGIESYDAAAVGKPFAIFFDMNETEFSGMYKEGVATSATFIPMSTNIYDPISWKTAPDEFIEGMFYNYGFHRKALYIDTSTDSALDSYRTNKVGNLRVATLKDLSFADKDISLYIDDNFYNANELAELQGKAMDRLDNVDNSSTTETWWEGIWTKAKDIFDMSIYEIAKTSEKTKYNNTLIRNVDAFNKDELPDAAPKGKNNQRLLSSYEIQQYISIDKDPSKEYSMMQAFAALSGVYRDKDLVDVLNTYLEKPMPVFVSSKNLCLLPEAEDSAKNTVYNYMLLKNLEANTPIGYETSMDMTSPLYMDLFGNIVTESGLVVIPAAANATLHTADYSPYNAALLFTYGDDYKLTKDYAALEDHLSMFFTLIDDEFELTQVKTATGNLNTALLSVGDKETLTQLKALYAYDLEAGSLEFVKGMNNIIEVLRGAPIENIDKNFEGLNTVRRLDKNGLVAASKLETLLDAVDQKGINTVLKLPNLAYIDGLEYIILFMFKLMMLAIIIIWMVTIYLDAVGGRFSIRTIGKCLGALVLVLTLILVIPATYDITYYESNKYLLQDEVSYLQMLNLEKTESGVEIGVTAVEEPDLSTKLYLKLDSISYHWYDMFDDILTASTFETLEEVYKGYNSAFATDMQGIETLNDGVYVSTDTLFKSSSVNFNPVSQNIYQNSNTDTAASYYTPYYAFLDALISNVNIYNNQNNVFAYTTKIQGGGRIKTLSLVAPYFKSEYFMQGNIDVIGLNEIYGIIDPTVQGSTLFTAESLKQINQSQWCNVDLPQSDKMERIDKLLSLSTKYINENKNLIGKVTDETFLKSMALYLAIEHNKLFNTQHADALEIYNLSNEDLMRLSMANKETVMKNSPLSFARFVYEVGGTTSVFMAALYSIVTLAASWICPLSVLIVFLVSFLSIFVYRILLGNKTKSLLGMLSTTFMICGMNVVHALLLKATVHLGGVGRSATVCIIIQILIQIVYLFLLVKIVITTIKDWRNMGYKKHNEMFERITQGNIRSYIPQDARRRKSGWEYYESLQDKQDARTRGVYYEKGDMSETTERNRKHAFEHR